MSHSNASLAATARPCPLASSTSTAVAGTKTSTRTPVYVTFQESPFHQEAEHPERPSRVAGIKRVLQATGLIHDLTLVDGHEISLKELSRFHTLEHVDAVLKLADQTREMHFRRRQGVADVWDDSVPVVDPNAYDESERDLVDVSPDDSDSAAGSGSEVSEGCEPLREIFFENLKDSDDSDDSDYVDGEGSGNDGERTTCSRQGEVCVHRHTDDLPCMIEARHVHWGSVYATNATPRAARAAAGKTLAVVRAVMRDPRADASGVAVVRPPGHHATTNDAAGFCLFHNVAVCVANLQHMWPGDGPRSGLDGSWKTGAPNHLSGASSLPTRTPPQAPNEPSNRRLRVCVLDMDVHSGTDGTHPNAFAHSPDVLTIDLHRYMHGSFYPGGVTGHPSTIGSGAGRGSTVNIGWNHALPGDGDYQFAYNHIVLPLIREFDPDLVIVSAGCDCVAGDPLGGANVSPKGYAQLLKQVRAICPRMVVVLEGGYNLDSISAAFACIVDMLLGYRTGTNGQSSAERGIIRPGAGARLANTGERETHETPRAIGRISTVQCAQLTAIRSLQHDLCSDPHPLAVLAVRETLSFVRSYWDCLRQPKLPLAKSERGPVERRRSLVSPLYDSSAKPRLQKARRKSAAGARHSGNKHRVSGRSIVSQRTRRKVPTWLAPRSSPFSRWFSSH